MRNDSVPCFSRIGAFIEVLLECIHVQWSGSLLTLPHILMHIYRLQMKFGVRWCFYICVSFCSQGGGFLAYITGHMTSSQREGSWLPSMHHRSHDQGGGMHPEGSASRRREVCIQGGGSASREKGDLHLRGGGLHQGVLGRPPPRELAKWAILLECFLVMSLFLEPCRSPTAKLARERKSFQPLSAVIFFL